MDSKNRVRGQRLSGAKRQLGKLLRPIIFIIIWCLTTIVLYCINLALDKVQAHIVFYFFDNICIFLIAVYLTNTLLSKHPKSIMEQKEESTPDTLSEAAIAAIEEIKRQDKEGMKPLFIQFTDHKMNQDWVADNICPHCLALNLEESAKFYREQHAAEHN